MARAHDPQTRDLRSGRVWRGAPTGTRSIRSTTWCSAACCAESRPPRRRRRAQPQHLQGSVHVSRAEALPHIPNARGPLDLRVEDSPNIHLAGGGGTRPASRPVINRTLRWIRDVRARPLDQHHDPIAEPDQVHDVHEQPDQPSDQSGQVDASELRNRCGAADGRHRARVVIDERLHRLPLDAPHDVSCGVPRLLLRNGRDTRERLPVGAVARAQDRRSRTAQGDRPGGAPVRPARGRRDRAERRATGPAATPQRPRPRSPCPPRAGVSPIATPLLVHRGDARVLPHLDPQPLERPPRRVCGDPPGRSRGCSVPPRSARHATAPSKSTGTRGRACDARFRRWRRPSRHRSARRR